jgi:hypothetical protein
MSRSAAREAAVATEATQDEILEESEEQNSYEEVDSLQEHVS